MLRMLNTIIIFSLLKRNMFLFKSFTSFFSVTSLAETQADFSADGWMGSCVSSTNCRNRDTDTRIASHARRWFLVKGRVELAGTQSRCICITDGTRSGGARSPRNPFKLLLNKTGLLCSPTEAAALWRLWDYLSLSLVGFNLWRRWTAEHQKAGETSGEEACLYAEKRANLPARLCVFAR